MLKNHFRPPPAAHAFVTGFVDLLFRLLVCVVHRNLSLYSYCTHLRFDCRCQLIWLLQLIHLSNIQGYVQKKLFLSPSLSIIYALI